MQSFVQKHISVMKHCSA